MASLTDLVQAFQAVRKQWLLIAEQYQDMNSLEAAMERSHQLRSTNAYKKSEELLIQKMSVLEEELLRHQRNIK